MPAGEPVVHHVKCGPEKRNADEHRGENLTRKRFIRLAPQLHKAKSTNASEEGKDDDHRTRERKISGIDRHSAMLKCQSPLRVSRPFGESIVIFTEASFVTPFVAIGAQPKLERENPPFNAYQFEVQESFIHRNREGAPGFCGDSSRSRSLVCKGESTNYFGSRSFVVR